jgi:hypothetical protein
LKRKNAFAEGCNEATSSPEKFLAKCSFPTATVKLGENAYLPL